MRSTSGRLSSTFAAQTVRNNHLTAFLSIYFHILYHPFVVHFVYILYHLFLCSDRKPAILEELEINQFVWGILETLQNSEFDEVVIDSFAMWKPVLLTKNIKEKGSAHFENLISLTIPINHFFPIAQIIMIIFIELI